MLNEIWTRSWQALGADGDGALVKQQLIQAYQEPHRKYHTLQHLKECLAIYQEHFQNAQNAAEVAIALWFHDAIYNVKALDNEERSASWAIEALSAGNAHPKHINKIKSHILATRHAQPPQGDDQKLLVDIDLSILGAQASRFEQYELQVRQEYSFVPDFFFNRKRKKLLQSFLDRENIFLTPPFQQKYEARARYNISRSIAALNGAFALTQ